MAPLYQAAAALLLSWGAHATHGKVSNASDPGWELFVTNTDRRANMHSKCYPAPGLPEYVRGSYFVGGPAIFELDGYRYQSIFDGLGQINRFVLGDKEICYTSAMLNTGMYELALKQGPIRGVLFEDTVPSRPRCPDWLPMCNLMSPNDNNWVNLIPMGDGNVALLSDQHEMVQMDMETLNCSGIRRWGDDRIGNPGKRIAGLNAPNWVKELHQPVSSSAHPLLRPGTKTYVHVLTEAPELAGHSYVDVYTFDGETSSPKQKRTLLARIQTEKNQYFHSYGVTERFAVLPFNMEMPMPKLTGTPTLMDSFNASWKGIHVVDADGQVQVFQTDPFFHTHTINTYENETGIIMDLGVFNECPFSKSPVLDLNEFLDKEARDGLKNRNGVRRLHLHLSGSKKGQATYEDLIPLGKRQTDFFKINDAFNGKTYCIYYAVEWFHNDVNYASMAILKHNVCTGEKTYWNRFNTYPGEPFFIGRSDGKTEDDGTVVFVAIDGETKTSAFVVLDAKTMSESEVVHLPVHIPFTAHGQFIPQGASAKEAAAEVFV